MLALPAPTATDITSGEEKIQGILKILEGPRQEVARYLQCNPADLERVTILRSREQYPHLEATLEKVNGGVPQAALF